MAKKTFSSVALKGESLKKSIKNVFIAVMGVTGSGKTSFISQCTKQSNTIVQGLEICTKGVEIFSFIWNNHICVHMIDFPGFDDTHRTDCEVFRDVAGWMTIAYEQNMNLSGIIYLCRITDPRIGGIQMRNLTIFKELFGSKCFSKVTLVSTEWHLIEPTIGVAREQELTSTEQFWGSMVKQGSRVARDDRDSAMSIVDSIVERQRTIVLEIQDQMVNKRLRLDETAAGQFMSQELLRQRNKYQQEIRNLQEEMREAIHGKDEDYTQFITQELGEVREKIDREDLDQQVRNLRVSSENLKWEREREPEKIRDEMSQRAT